MLGKAAQHAQHLVARHGDVEQVSGASVAGLAGLGQRPVDRRNTEPLRHTKRGVEAHVEYPGDRQLQALIGRQMGGADDSARTDDDNGLRARRDVPRLPQGGCHLNLSPTRELSPVCLLPSPLAAVS